MSGFIIVVLTPADFWLDSVCKGVEAIQRDLQIVAFESDDEFVEPGLAVSANIVDDGRIAAGKRHTLAVLVLEGFIHSEP